MRLNLWPRLKTSLSALVLFILFSAGTTLSLSLRHLGSEEEMSFASSTNSNTSPETCDKAVAGVNFHVQAVTEGGMECDYSHVGASCGTVPIVYTPGRPSRPTNIRYTEKEYFLEANSPQPVWYASSSTVPIHPKTDVIDVTSNGISLLSTLSCRCKYEKVMHQKAGFYCRIPDVRLLKTTDPAPKATRTDSSVTYPLDCKVACENNPDCVLSMYSYNKKECYHHGPSSFSDSFTVVDMNTSPGSDDIVAFHGKYESILRSFATSLSKGLNTPSPENVFMGPAFEEAKRCKHFEFFTEQSYTFEKDKHPYNSGATANAVYQIISMAESIFLMEQAHVSTSLPALDGPSTIDHLMAGQQALTSLETSIANYETNRNIADLKIGLSGILGGQVDAILQQGSFDFEFMVAEFSRLDTRIDKYTEKLESSLDTVEDLAVAAKLTGLAEAALQTAFVVSKAMASSAGLANPFAVGASDVDKIIQNWRDVQLEMNKYARLEATFTLMEEAAEVYTEQLEGSKSHLEALRDTAYIATEFIDSYKDGGFEVQLTNEKASLFLESYSRYSPPYSMTELKGAHEKMKASMDLLCKIIFEGLTVVTAGVFQYYCVEMTIQLNSVISNADKTNTAGYDLVVKSKEIISQYVLVSKNQHLLDMIENNLEQSIEAETQYAMLLTSSTLKLFALNNLYTMHVVELCNLAEYYDGGGEIQLCKDTRSAVNIISTNIIFSNLQALMKDASVPSTTYSLCGYVPMEAEDKSAHQSFSVHELKHQGETSFEFPMDDAWLRKFGWDVIANGVHAGRNYFVQKIQLPFPYTALKDSSCGNYYDTTVYAMDEHTVISRKGEQLLYRGGGNFISYSFVYADSDRVNCGTIPVDNFMDVCTVPGDPKLNSPMCIVSDGTVENYMPFDTRPPLPSMFSTFEVVAPTAQNCMDTPEMGTHIAEVTRNETAGTVMEELRNNLLAPMCVEVRVTNSGSRFDAVPNLASKSKCSHCPPGEFHTSQVFDKYGCTACPGGTFQSKSGMYACELCRPGTYQPKEGQTECVKCPSDKDCSVPGLKDPMIPR